ncbi:MAG TPA: AgmX/PglI C-terminal domain-containing protein [Myxococcota bacterium]|jgi:outer membrane biosynthesis protein TonB|nr:AgmX/PglI C-terminal domain-containing protein [Myxococcota bacterium]
MAAGGAPQTTKSGGPAGAPPRGPAAPPKVLRIGVIQAGKIIEERLLRQKETVTVGQSPACTVVMPDPNFAARQILFDLHGDQYVLTFDDKMTGKLSIDGKPVDLAQLRADPRTKRPKPGMYQLPIGDRTRGKVVVGDVTVLFQFVQPPPLAPKPVLPAAVRGGIFSEMDWTFASILLVLGIAMGPTLWYIQRIPIPKDIEMEDVPDRFAKFIMKPPEKPDAAVDEKAGDDKKAEDEEKKGDEKPPDAKAHGPAKVVSDEEKARAAAEARAKILDSARTSAGLLGIIGSKTAGGGGAVADVLSGGGLSGDVDAAFKGMGGVKIADGDTAGGLGGHGGVGAGAGTVAGLAAGEGAVGGVGSADAGAKSAEKAITGRVVGSAPASVDGALDSAAVADVVKRRLSAIKDCYERELKRKPKLAGKIRIRFTINAAGRVDAGATKVVENGMGDDEVAACMTDRISKWRFPTPEGGGSVTVEYPFVFTASGG